MFFNSKKIKRINALVVLGMLFLSFNSIAQKTGENNGLKYFNNEALKYKKKGNINKYRGALIELGQYQYENTLYKESIETFNKAKQVRPFECDSLQFEALIGLGKGFTKQAMYASALENFVKALNIAKKVNQFEMKRLPGIILALYIGKKARMI